MAEDYLFFDAFGSPRTSTALPRGQLSPVEQVAWVEARQDYLYLGAGMTDSMTSGEPLAYENPERVIGGLNVLFADGSVRWMERSEAAALIGFADEPPTDPPPPPPEVDPPDTDILQSRQNLLDLWQAAYRYANARNGYFPPDLGTLFETGYITEISTFLNPRLGTVPPPGEWSTQEKVDWINLNADYALPAAGERYWDQTVLLNEKRQGLEGGIYLFFQHGLYFVDMGWALEALAPQAPPEVLTANFEVDAPRQTLRFCFTEDASGGLESADLVLTNLTTGQEVPQAFIAASYDFATQSALFTFPGYTRGILPDGDYRATLKAGSVRDTAGDVLPEAATVTFHVLAGDADRDRDVDFFDFLTLRSNYGQSDQLFSDGDFDYDGDVDFFDFLILRGNYGGTPAPPGASRSLFRGGDAIRP